MEDKGKSQRLKESLPEIARERVQPQFKEVQVTADDWRAIKIRVFPNQDQKLWLQKLIAAARKTYNLCLAAYKNNNSIYLGKVVMRDLFRDAFISSQAFDPPEEGKTKQVKKAAKQKAKLAKKAKEKEAKAIAKAKGKEEKESKQSKKVKKPKPKTAEEIAEGKQKQEDFARKVEEYRVFLSNQRIPEELSWLKEIPYDVRDEALQDLLKNIESNRAKQAIARQKGKEVKKFELKFRSVHDKEHHLKILKKHWNTGLWKQVFSPDTLQGEKINKLGTNRIPQKLAADSTLKYTWTGKYYLCLPQPIEKKPDDFYGDDSQGKVIALDPGVRTFMTGYDPSGAVVEFGSQDMTKIWKIKDHYARLHSQLAKDRNLRQAGKPSLMRHRERYLMKKLSRKLNERIQFLIQDIHRKLAKWLCENYRVVLLPSFDVSQMVRKKKGINNVNRRKIGRKTVSEMLSWSHYKFKQMVQWKAREYPGCQVIICDEAYTSKTCGQCGTIKDNLGGNKVYKCAHCHMIMDRDFNGARNVLLKYLSMIATTTPPARV